MMKQHPKISVVVPVYKVEEFLPQCIDSILSQTYANFRVVLVDDGSPDRCGTICDEYALKDSRITVIHQENGGVTRARATGVNAAGECDYITFVDSDDSLPPMALQTLCALADEEYDIIVGSYDRNTKRYVNGEIDKAVFVEGILKGDISSAPYAKLFRRDLFTDKVFSTPRDIVMGEDLIMNLHLAFACKRMIRMCDRVVYHYRDMPTGVMNTFKYTLEYLEKSYAVKKNAIPEAYRMQCMPACLYNIVIFTHLIMGYYLHAGCSEKTVFHQQLLSDMQRYNFRQLPVERFALKFSNPLASLTYLAYYHLKGLLKRCKRILLKNRIENRPKSNG